MGLTLPVTLPASIFRTVGPGEYGWSRRGIGVERKERLVAGAGVAALVSPPDCGMISIAQICGFSTLGVKVILILPSVTSTGTVST